MKARSALVLLLGLALPTTGCQLVLGIDDPADDDGGPPGWLFYTTDVGGTNEIWAIPDRGGQPVRVTRDLSEGNVDELKSLTASWDGTRLAVTAMRRADGVFDRNRHLWVLGVDGADLRHVIQVVDDPAFFGLSWQGDNRHIVFAGGERCANDLRRVDVDDADRVDVLWDGSVMSAQPMVAPDDPSDILFVDRDCDYKMVPRRLDAGHATVSDIPDIVPDHPRYQRLRRSSDNSRFAYAFRNTVYLHDFETEVAVYQDPDTASTFDVPCFGNRDTRLYAKWCSGANQCDLAAIDPITGDKRLLGVPDIRSDIQTSVSVTWAAVAGDLDSDHDGVADGLEAAR